MTSWQSTWWWFDAIGAADRRFRRLVEPERRLGALPLRRGHRVATDQTTVGMRGSTLEALFRVPPLKNAMESRGMEALEALEAFAPRRRHTRDFSCEGGYAERAPVLMNFFFHICVRKRKSASSASTNSPTY